MALRVDNINIMLCLYWASLLNSNEITLSFFVLMNVFLNTQNNKHLLDVGLLLMIMFLCAINCFVDNIVKYGHRNIDSSGSFCSTKSPQTQRLFIYCHKWGGIAANPHA